MTDETQIKVDIGVLKNQVEILCTLCNKMDLVIEKLVDQQEKQVDKIYNQMDITKAETDADIKEIHNRIDTVITKLHDSELNLMNEMKKIRDEINHHGQKEKEALEKLLQWKWMIIGGILVASVLLSNVNVDTLWRFLK